MNSLDPSFIKRVKEKYKALGGMSRGGLPTSRFFYMIYVIISLLQEIFKNFDYDGVVKYASENMTFLVQNINVVAE